MPPVLPVNQRLKELLEVIGYKKIDPFVKAHFGEGARSERLRSALNSGTPLKTDFLVEITDKIAEVDNKKVNGHWLLTGEGSMFLDEKAMATPENDAAIERALTELYEDLKHLRKTNGELTEAVLNFSRVQAGNQG